MDVPPLWKDTNIFYNILCFLITENEKAFDRCDARLYWKTVFHTLLLSHHVYVGLFATSLDLINYPAPEIQQLYTFRAAYLTGWGFTFQTAFAFLALASDALEWTDRRDTSLAKKVTYCRDVVFNALVVPYTLFVTTMFWCIFWVDRELVFPEVYDAIIPWWFNHCVHTNISVIVLVETLLTARRHPANKKLELIINTVVAFGYAVVYYSIYFATNRWLYNIFGVMTWWQVCFYQIVIWCSNYVFYFINFPINRLIHGSEDKSTVENEPDVRTTENKANGTDFTKNMLECKSEFTKENFSVDNWNLKSTRGDVENSRL